MTIFISIDFGLPGAVDTQGARPYTGTNALWNSSSIWLDGGLSQTQTKVGRPTTIKVRVSASERAYQFVTVDAYVMSPFAGPFQPSNALRTLQGFAGQITVGSGQPVPNDSHVVTCMIQDPVQGGIPWEPDDDDLEATNDGHLCLIANAYAEEPVDGAPQPGTTPFDVVSNPHHGQRNINVLEGDNIKKFQFMVFGPIGGGEFRLDVRRLSAKDFGASERWALSSHRHIVEIPKGSGRLFLATKPGAEPIPLRQSRDKLAGSIDLGDHGTPALAELADGATLKAPEECLVAMLSVERDDEPGALLGFDIAVRDATGDLGGLRILTLTS